MIDIFKFYVKFVVQLFNRIYQSFYIADGLPFGTFLLGCGLFVVFINLLRFQFGTNGIDEIKSFRNRKQLTLINSKHGKGKNSIDGYYPMHGKRSGRYR